MTKNKQNILQLFDNVRASDNYLKVCAPMVRYSKVQFRTLVRSYAADLCFTPMVLADSFCQNEKARSSEFSTTVHDTPVVVQFAANNVNDFLDATKLIYPYADGVDLNCGCPQRWAMKDGYGSALLSKPDLICDLIKGVRNSFPSDFSVSVKIRILDDLNKTIEMCRQMEKCGVSFLTVHGRTPSQKSSGDVNVNALKEVCLSTKLPIIVNGGVKSLEDADNLYKEVKCDGVMVASGLLTNPALFIGTDVTPLSCVKRWIDIKNRNPDKITFQVYHHHLVFMLEKVLTKLQKQTFNYLNTFEKVDNYLFEHLLDRTLTDEMHDDEPITCEFSHDIIKKHSSKCRGCGKSLFYCICSDKYDPNSTHGSFFTSYLNKSASDVDYFDCNLFDEDNISY